ncbi:MAG: hypothetical protein KAW41_03400 [Candidatus Diapherotrites archaeon]|nr:hypothetical protein [Candidatus Diapherotrites archaeon]
MKKYLSASAAKVFGEEGSVPTDQRIAQCVGLWLAEGDNKTIREITFTNNCIELVEFFGNTIQEHYKDEEFNARVYIYSKEDAEEVTPNLKNVRIRRYIDNRARKPYLLFRLAKTKLAKEWKETVRDFCGKEEYYGYILQGFFAGEGNIHYSLKHHHRRSVRISQGIPNPLIERMLDYFGLSYRFTPSNRMYSIFGLNNLRTVDRIGLTLLHKDKREKFKEMMSTVKEEHYSANYLKTQAYKDLKGPTTARALSKKYKRSFARIQDVLIELKKEGKIMNYQSGSLSYWIRMDSNTIIISQLKKSILDTLDTPRRTFEVAKELNRAFKTTKLRLKELEKLGLVKKEGLLWKKVETNKKIKIL